MVGPAGTDLCPLGGPAADLRTALSPYSPSAASTPSPSGETTNSSCLPVSLARLCGGGGSLHSPLVFPVWASTIYPVAQARNLGVVLTLCTLYPLTSNPSQISLGTPTSPRPVPLLSLVQAVVISLLDYLSSLRTGHLYPFPILYSLCMESQSDGLETQIRTGHQTPLPVALLPFRGFPLLIQVLE